MCILTHYSRYVCIVCSCVQRPLEESTLKVAPCTLLGAVGWSQPSWEERVNNVTTIIVCCQIVNAIILAIIVILFAIAPIAISIIILVLGSSIAIIQGSWRERVNSG